MSGKLLASVIAGLFLVGCAGQSVAHEPSPRPDPDCDGSNRDAPVVIVNLKTKEAEPECVGARLGSIILFRFKVEESSEDGFIAEERLEDVTVRIQPDKPFEDAWLRRRNDYIDDAVIIKVPGRHVPKERHSYTYHVYRIVVGDMTIDPRIEIEH